MYKKGFAPIVFLIICGVIGLTAVFGIPYVYNKVINNVPNTVSTPTVIKSDNPSPTITSTLTISPITTIRPTQTAKPKTPTPRPATPKPTPTPTPISTPSCNYDLTSASGAIQFTFNLSKGSATYWSTVVEVKAQNGCKVLDGASTDVIQRFKTPTSTTLAIPSLPAGTYDVRYSYNQVWGSSQSVTVTSGQQSNVTFSIDNSSDP